MWTYALGKTHADEDFLENIIGEVRHDREAQRALRGSVALERACELQVIGIIQNEQPVCVGL
jgi:hypothetical protein